MVYFIKLQASKLQIFITNVPWIPLFNREIPIFERKITENFASLAYRGSVKFGLFDRKIPLSLLTVEGDEKNQFWILPSPDLMK